MKSYFETLKSNPLIIEELILESPHTRFLDVPEEFEFLRNSIVDLGFENLSLDESEYKRLMLSFVKDGLKIPNTKYKIRATSGLKSVIEINDNQDLLELPENWKEAIYTMDLNTDEIKYSGSLVRKDQT